MLSECQGPILKNWLVNPRTDDAVVERIFRVLCHRIPRTKQSWLEHSDIRSLSMIEIQDCWCFFTVNERDKSDK